MATALEGRRPKYLDRYARRVAAAARYEEAQKDIQDEQDRIQYLDSLIASERQTVAELQRIFAAEPTNFADSQRLLKEAGALDTAIRQAEAQQQQAAARAAVLPPEAVAELDRMIRTGAPGQARRAALQLIETFPGAAPKVLAQATRAAARLQKGDLEAIREAAGQARAPKAGVPRGTQERLEEMGAAAQEALETAYFAGEAGIRGGFAGKAIADLRELTAAQLRERAETAADEAQKKLLTARADALDASDFATGAEALDAALAVVRTTGDPSQVEDPLARTMYEEARQRRAYRNDQRADFEQEVLDSRKRLAGLEQEKTKLKGAYDDPRQELLRRTLRTQGFKVEDPYVFRDGRYEVNPQAWKNAYLRYQNTPEYDFYIGAHERVDRAVEAGETLEPSTRGERLAVSFTMMRGRRGENTSPAELAKQLEKAGLKGKDLTDAVSFTMAWWNLGGPEQTQQTVEARKKKEAQEAETEKVQRDAATDLAKRADQEREALQAQEKRAAEAVGVLRERQDLAQKRETQAAYTKEYRRQMAMGATREEAVQRARAKALEVAEATGELRPDIGGAVADFRAASGPAPAPAPFVPGPEQEIVFKDSGPITVEEAEGRFQDPNAPRLSYRRTDGGIEVFRDGTYRATAQPGTDAFRSIESVMGGGDPLPQPAPAAPAPAAAAAAPAPAPEEEDLDYSKLSKEELEAIVRRGSK